MANVALFPPSGDTQYLLSVHTPDYVGNPDAIINPDVSAVIAVPVKYWQRTGDLITEMDLIAKAAKDASLAAVTLAANRAEADALADDPDAPGIEWRAVGLLLLDEVNALRGWIEAFKATTAATVSLADFKTRVAALPSMPNRTLAQAKAAYKNAIGTGTADRQGG